MDLVLILAIFGLQTILFLMGIFTLKGRMNSLEEQTRANRVHIEGQTQRLNANLEEIAQFNEKALGTLSQNMAMCGYEVKEVKDKLKMLMKLLGKKLLRGYIYTCKINFRRIGK